MGTRPKVTELVHIKGPPTVGQEAVELICQNAWKTRQNETFSLWILLSPKPESFLMKVPRKMIFNHFFHFWPCQVPLWAVGAEKQPAERPPTEKPKVFQKYLRTWGEGRNDHIELGPSVCQWIQNINLIRLPEGPNWPTVPPHLKVTSSKKFRRSTMRFYF